MINDRQPRRLEVKQSIRVGLRSAEGLCGGSMLKFPSLLVGNADSAQQKVAGDAKLRKLL
jgi:hypothetical protein